MFKKLLMAILAAGAFTATAQKAPEAPATLFPDIVADTVEVEEVADPFLERYTGHAAIDAFINAPEEIFPTVDHMTRMDMADYFNSGSPKPSKNAFKGDCRIIAADDNQVTFTSTDAAVTELSLLPMKSDTIIMVINTLRTPAEDSSVRFYTYPYWRPVEKGLFMVPGLDEWTADNTTVSRDDIENAVPFILARFTYAPATGVLTLENKLGDYLPEEANKIAKGALKEKLTYKWNGSRMVKAK